MCCYNISKCDEAEWVVCHRYSIWVIATYSFQFLLHFYCSNLHKVFHLWILKSYFGTVFSQMKLVLCLFWNTSNSIFDVQQMTQFMWGHHICHYARFDFAVSEIMLRWSWYCGIGVATLFRTVQVLYVVSESVSFSVCLIMEESHGFGNSCIAEQQIMFNKQWSS